MIQSHPLPDAAEIRRQELIAIAENIIRNNLCAVMLDGEGSTIPWKDDRGVERFEVSANAAMRIRLCKEVASVALATSSLLLCEGPAENPQFGGTSADKNIYVHNVFPEGAYMITPEEGTLIRLFALPGPFAGSAPKVAKFHERWIVRTGVECIDAMQNRLVVAKLGPVSLPPAPQHLIDVLNAEVRR